MQHPSLLAATCGLLSLSLAAQSGPTYQVITSTDYSMVADNGAGEVIDGKPFNTTLTLPFTLSAKSHPGASASHRSELVHSGSLGKGLRIRESGSGSSSSANGSALAGTLDEVGPQHHEPHSLFFVISNVTQPTGIVTIEWQASASGAESLAETSIDLNGDLMPDFARGAGKEKVTESFPVTAIAGAYYLRITTHAGVDIEGRGSGDFSLDLKVWFREGTGCTVSSYGEPCAGALTAEIEKKHAATEVELRLEDAAKHAQGALVVGDLPADLPFGACRLLVAPVVALPFMTDGGGKAKVKLSLPAGLPFTARVQGALDDGALGTSNALRLGCN